MRFSLKALWDLFWTYLSSLSRHLTRTGKIPELLNKLKDKHWNQNIKYQSGLEKCWSQNFIPCILLVGIRTLRAFREQTSPTNISWIYRKYNYFYKKDKHECFSRFQLRTSQRDNENNELDINFCYKSLTFLLTFKKKIKKTKQKWPQYAFVFRISVHFVLHQKAILHAYQSRDFFGNHSQKHRFERRNRIWRRIQCS